MKTTALLLTFFILTNSVNAQSKIDCSKYIEYEYDKMTGDTTIKSKTIKIVHPDGKALSLYWIKDNKNSPEWIVARPINSGSCVDNECSILFLLRDNTRLSLQNQSGFNCDPEFLVCLWKNENSFDILKSKKIASIRVETTKSFFQSDLTEQQAIFFTNSGYCISQKR